MNAQEKISELHQEIEATEQAERERIMIERHQARAIAEERQARVNQLIEHANALLLQNRDDLLIAIEKAEAAVAEARAISRAHNSEGSAFLLNESIALFCGEPFEDFKKSLASLVITTPSRVPVGAIRVQVNAGGLTTGFGGNQVYHRAGSVLVFPEQEAERMIRRGTVLRVD